MDENKNEYVLALYDFRSKQEYIYRTNRIKEISGASALLSSAYKLFAEKAGLEYDLETKFLFTKFEEKVNNDAGFKGMIIYDGGGNLMVLFRDHDAYIKANHIFSEMLRDKLYTAGIIASCVKYSGNFAKDRKALYISNRKKKNTGNVTLPYSVFPFTQIDRESLMPVTYKKTVKYKEKDKTGKEIIRTEQLSLTKESYLKQRKYMDPEGKSNDKALDEIIRDYPGKYLDSIVTEKGRESLLAIIYIDGNGMGERLKKATDDIKKQNPDGSNEEYISYDAGVAALREFSADTDNAFVKKPIAAIEEFLSDWQKSHPGKAHMGRYRRVIAGGDEITIICNARLAKDIVKTYFEKLDSENSKNYACAGIAIFHSHAPFSDMYEIAEQCCESGKKSSRAFKSENKSDKNYIDFHFCRSAVTNDMDIIRKKQEKDYTKRPYELSEFIEFCTFADKLSIIGRSNIKELANALIRGRSYYLAEVGRILSRYPGLADLLEKDHKNDADKLIFDVAQVYDLWFEKEPEEPEKTEKAEKTKKTEGGAE